MNDWMRLWKQFDELSLIGGFFENLEGQIKVTFTTDAGVDEVKAAWKQFVFRFVIRFSMKIIYHVLDVHSISWTTNISFYIT